MMIDENENGDDNVGNNDDDIKDGDGSDNHVDDTMMRKMTNIYK